MEATTDYIQGLKSGYDLHVNYMSTIPVKLKGHTHISNIGLSMIKGMHAHTLSAGCIPFPLR